MKKRIVLANAHEHLTVAKPTRLHHMNRFGIRICLSHSENVIVKVKHLNQLVAIVEARKVSEP